MKDFDDDGDADDGDVNDDGNDDGDGDDRRKFRSQTFDNIEKIREEKE